MSNFDLNISVLTPGPGTADGCLDLDVTLSVRGGEGGNRTSHHLIPIQQHNIFKTRPAFAIVKPLVGEVMRQTLNWTDLNSFALGLETIPKFFLCLIGYSWVYIYGLMVTCYQLCQSFLCKENIWGRTTFVMTLYLKLTTIKLIKCVSRFSVSIRQPLATPGGTGVWFSESMLTHNNGHLDLMRTHL